MSNYAPDLAQSQNGDSMQDYPAPKLAKARYSNENNTASSVISVTHDTTALEVAAVDKTAFLRWVATADTQASVIGVAGATASYDHVIPAGTLRRFVIPRESLGSSQRSVQGVNRGEGLYQRVAIKTAGISSVLTTEY